MMENSSCAQCGVEFEGAGVAFRGRVFCGDECCEAFEADIAAKGEPGSADLDDDDVIEDDDLDVENLGYSGEDMRKEGRPDDDFDIEADDF